MKQGIYKTLSAVATALIVLLVILVGVLFGGRLLGIQTFIVQSGSMEPEYPVGALVYVKPVDTRQLQVGDVITFRLGGSRGTHRIIEIADAEGTVAFRTKGDSNEDADAGLVRSEDVIGQVVMGIPYLGYLVAYIQQPPGTYVAVTAAAVILLLTILPDIIFQLKKEEIK